MNKDFSGKIVDKIKKNKIDVKPKVFNYKSLLFWLIFAFLIILGGVAFSLMLISIFSFGRENLQYASGGFLKIFFMSIPYLWIVLFGLFAYFGFRAFRSTDKGYRQNFILILLIMFLASFSLGALLHITGVSKRMHQVMTDRVPLYHHLVPTKEGQWSRPGMGMVGGQIIRTGKDFIVVQDFKSRKTMVVYSDETILGKNVKLKKGERVRVVGERIDKKSFKAKVIQSWDGGDELSPQEKKKFREFRKERKK